MFPTPFRVILDADVLFPFTVRDTLLRAAERDLYQVHWTGQILDEARRALVAAGRITEMQAERLFMTMQDAFPEAMITGHELLIDAMQNDPKDRHVAAAAVKAGAQVIVTNNLRHFRQLPEGVEAQTADEFLGNLFDLAPDDMVDILKTQAALLRKPRRSIEDLLAGLAKSVPEFVAQVRAHGI